MKIAPFIHRCTIRTGPLEGNKTAQEVTPIEFQFDMKCEYCGDALAKPDQILAHIYCELVNGEDE